MDGTWEGKRDLAWRLYAPDGRTAGYVVGRSWRVVAPDGTWAGDAEPEATVERAKETCEAQARRLWEG